LVSSCIITSLATVGLSTVPACLGVPWCIWGWSAPLYHRIRLKHTTVLLVQD
jgi:hypothetical protein